MSDHLIAEANRHAMALPSTHPTHTEIAWYVREVVELRAENERLTTENNAAHAALIENQEQARLLGMSAERECDLRGKVERLQRELAAARARLDSGQILLTVAGERVWHSGVDLRAAIDAAREEAK